MLIPHVFFGTLRDHYIMLFGAAGLFAGGVGFTAAWVGARIGARAGARQVLQEATRDAARSDPRLEQIVGAVDAMSLELERMAEGQRFTARLLSERAAQAAPPQIPAPRRDAGTITPH